MKRAVLYLTTKTPEGDPFKELIVEMKFVQVLPAPLESLFYFSFQLDNEPKLEFKLTDGQTSIFFGMLDTMLSPSPSNPDPENLQLADDQGNTIGTMVTTTLIAADLGDDIHLYSFNFVPSTGHELAFSLTSTDTDAFFYDFDCLIWSNPPQPPH
jgi:hypothetical protein